MRSARWHEALHDRFRSFQGQEYVKRFLSKPHVFLTRPKLQQALYEAGYTDAPPSRNVDGQPPRNVVEARAGESCSTLDDLDVFLLNWLLEIEEHDVATEGYAPACVRARPLGDLAASNQKPAFHPHYAAGAGDKNQQA